MRTLTCLCLLATLAPATAQAQRGVDDPRLAAYLALGFGGDADLSSGSSSSSGDLDATVGFGFRAELALHRYIVLGGSFEMLTFEADGDYDSEREEVFDIDALLRVRYPIEISSEVWIEPYVTLPFGLSLAAIPGGDDDVWPGWNIGVLGGVYLGLAAAPVAFFVELGWRHHQVYNEVTVPILGTADLKIVTNQFALQLGAALRLE